MKYVISWNNELNEPKSTTITAEITNGQLISSRSFPEIPITDVKIYPILSQHHFEEMFNSRSFAGTVIKNDPLQIEISNGGVKENSLLIDQIQRKIPLGNAFLRRYNQDIAETIITETSSGVLTTSIGGVIHAQSIEFSNQDQILISRLSSDTILANHLKYVSSGNLELIYQDRQYQLEVQLEFQETENNLITLYLIPVDLRYGRGTHLETYNYPDTVPIFKQLMRRLSRTLGYWYTALRAEQFFITFLSIVLATILALSLRFQIDLVSLSFIIVGTFCIQAGGNLLNDYFDHESEADEINIVPLVSPTSNKMIQNKLIHPVTVLSVGLGLFIVGILIGLYLNAISPGQTVLILGLFGAMTTYFYTGEPLKLAYRGIGELILALNFGPLIIIGSYYVLTGILLTLSQLFSFTLAPLLIITGLLILNEIDDIEADKLVGKITTVVRLGRKNAIFLVISMMISAVVITIYPVFQYGSNVIITLSILLIGLGISLYSLRNILSDYTQSPNLKLYITIYFFWTLSIAIALLL